MGKGAGCFLVSSSSSVEGRVSYQLQLFDHVFHSSFNHFFLLIVDSIRGRISLKNV